MGSPLLWSRADDADLLGRCRRLPCIGATLTAVHMLGAVFLHLLLVGFELLFLFVRQNRFDLLRTLLMHAHHLRALISLRGRRISVHGLHLLLLILQDGLDLVLLISGEFVALGHVSETLIGIHHVAAMMATHATAFGLRSALGCGSWLLRKHHAGCHQSSEYEST